MNRDTLVLKLGGSVLRTPADYQRAVHEIYRHLRRGRRVVAVASAAHGATNALLAEAEAAGLTERGSAAALLASGERASAARLALALDRAGVPNVVLDPLAVGFVVRGEPLDARPAALDGSRIAVALEAGTVVVIPGFFGVRADGTVALLGRGGSDLTALALARGIGARCRLIKDVGAVFENDPSSGNGPVRRFRAVRWEDARRLEGGVIQGAALEFAAEANAGFEVGGLDLRAVTRVGARRTVGVESGIPERRLRVALLGHGTVGRGVFELARRLNDRFEMVAVVVRDPARHNDVAAELLATDPVAAAGGACDVVVELLGGEEPARTAIAAALAGGRDVVTANKLLVARHGDALRCVAAAGARLLHSAAVGGVVPMLETVRRARRGGRITAIEGVLNGTTNFVLDRLLAGASMRDAVADAERLGYAEPDSRLDLDGTDAAMKLVLLARAAFGSCELDDVRWRGIHDLDPARVRAAAGRGQVVRLLARAWREGRRVRGVVAPRRLSGTHPLAAAKGAGNRLLVHSEVDGTMAVAGQGAGRWPTAEAVVADLLDLWRLRVESPSLLRAREAGAAAR